jgi:hypothetical protein
MESSMEYVHDLAADTRISNWHYRVAQKSVPARTHFFLGSGCLMFISKFDHINLSH